MNSVNFTKYSFKITPHLYFKNYKETTTLLSPQSKFINDDLLFNIPIDSNFMDTKNFINRTWNTIDVYVEKMENEIDTFHFKEGSKFMIVSTFGRSDYSKIGDVFKEGKLEAKQMVIMLGRVVKNNTSSEEYNFMVVDEIYNLQGINKGFKAKEVLIDQDGYAFLVQKTIDDLSVWAIIDYGALNQSHKKEIYSLPAQFGEPLLFNRHD